MEVPPQAQAAAQPAKLDDETMRLLTTHQGLLYAYILSLHPNRTAAQDILQETNVALWKKRHLFEPGTNFKAWAFRFAKFQTLDHLKRVKNRGWLVFDDNLLEIISEEADETTEDFEEHHAALKRCLEKLGDAEQDLIRAHYQSGLPLQELSLSLGRSRAAVKQALFRIRQNLRVCISRQLAGQARPS